MPRNDTPVNQVSESEDDSRVTVRYAGPGTSFLALRRHRPRLAEDLEDGAAEEEQGTVLYHVQCGTVQCGEVLPFSA